MNKTYVLKHSTEKESTLNITIFEPDDTEDISGVIQIVHGMTEHIGRYEKIAEYFTKYGYVVVGNDIIGHGQNKRSDTDNIYMDNWFTAVEDIMTVRKLIYNKYGSTPVCLLGFSLGSFLVRSLTNKNDYKAQILVGTGYKPTILLRLVRLYLRIKYRKHMKDVSEEVKKIAFSNYNNKFKDKPENYWLLTDDAARKEYEDDKLVKTSFTPGFFCEFLRGMIYVNKQMKKHKDTIPTLIINGTHDLVGDGIEKVVSYYQSPMNADIKISGKTHDVLHDEGYEEVLDYIKMFIS